MRGLLLCGWASLFGVWADTYPRQAGVDVEHYAFRVSLSDLSDDVRGEARVEVRFVRDGVRELFLDLAMGMTVDGVAEGGAALEYRHQRDQLRIRFPKPAAAGALRTVTVRYHGVPAGGLRIGPNKYGDRTFFTSHWPNRARQWLPVIDHPYDKATSEFFVVAPVRYQVVANGLLQEETDLGGGQRMTHWKQSVPIASWLNAVAAAPFSVRYFGTAGGVALSNWVYPQDREKGMATFDGPTRRAMEFLTAFVGPYPYEKLANVESAGFEGGMEHASAIFYGEKAVTDKPATNLVAHEIAHQWFGNAVTERDWDDVWLSEGFATYFALLCTEHVDGREAFVQGLEQSRGKIFRLEATLPDTPVIHRNLADMDKILNRLVYEKGAWTLHMLRGLIGPEAFRNGVRDYYQRNRGGNASTADFQRVMEAHGGVRLGWFFDQWLRRAGTPSLEWWWEYEAGAVRVTVKQTQTGEVYRLPLEFGLDAMRVERVEMTKRVETFVFRAEKAPGEVRFDPNTWALAATDQ